MPRKGHGHKHSKHSKSGYYARISPEKPKEHELVVATKQAQNWARIIDALPDEETKQLALAEYAKIGEKRLGT